MSASHIEPSHLLKLRLVVARFGEMDLSRWWNTRGQLGRLGGLGVRRGFPRTHRFAQARSVFAVAAHRCAEVFNPPGGMTLWNLPPTIEDELDARWEQWLDDASAWEPFFTGLETMTSASLAQELRTFELVSDTAIAANSRLRRSAEGRAVAIPSVFAGTNEDLDQLALAFSLGEVGALAVPYMRSGPA